MVAHKFKEGSDNVNLYRDSETLVGIQKQHTAKNRTAEISASGIAMGSMVT